MIMPQTRVRVADNTGARELMCIRVVAGGSKFESAHVTVLGEGNPDDEVAVNVLSIGG